MRRAPKLGRRTRHVTVRGRTKRSRPLTLSMAIHPQRAVPTPVHPACGTYETQYGYMLELARTLRPHHFFEGTGLRPRRTALCTYKVVRTDLPKPRTLGWSDSLLYAVGWKLAAQQVVDGLKVEVQDTRR